MRISMEVEVKGIVETARLWLSRRQAPEWHSGSLSARIEKSGIKNFHAVFVYNDLRAFAGPFDP
jgi:hypothetical protein